MTTTSVTSEPLSSGYLSSYSSSSFQNFTRRHSIYGTEDRVVLDIGSLYIKCGFSGESAPRHLVPTWSCLDLLRSEEGEVIRVDKEVDGLYCLDVAAKGNMDEIEEKLKKLLHDIYFRLLLTDPKTRKVIICESPLAPVAIKQVIAKLLFNHFLVPSISFVPVHLMALFTTGLTTGLVVDCGNLESTALPIYFARPMIPYISTTPLAGRSITNRLRELLYEHGRFIPSSNLHMSLAPQTSIPNQLLTPDLLEDIKARALFCSPLMIMAEQQETGDPMSTLESYKSFSSATDLYYPVTLKDNTRGTLLIPGWIRERTAEVLFEGDEDELSLPMCIMESLLKVQPDLRKPLISSMLLIGGVSLIPGFQSRLKQELLRMMRDPDEREKRQYKSLLKLHKSIGFLDNSEEKGAGRIFMNNVRGWIGGSLVGSLKLSGEEITKEKFAGNVTDWSIGNWSTDSDVSDANTSTINK